MLGWCSDLWRSAPAEGIAVGAILVAPARGHGPLREAYRALQTFADQAVIAIENVRLFDEVQARTAELQESLEYQTATSDVLNVISRSPSDSNRSNAIVETAADLCRADFAFVYKLEFGIVSVAASNNPEAEFVKYLRDHPASRGAAPRRPNLTREAHSPRCGCLERP